MTCRCEKRKRGKQEALGQHGGMVIEDMVFVEGIICHSLGGFSASKTYSQTIIKHCKLSTLEDNSGVLAIERGS